MRQHKPKPHQSQRHLAIHMPARLWTEAQCIQHNESEQHFMLRECTVNDVLYPIQLCSVAY
jgi:hypothetical protein